MKKFLSLAMALVMSLSLVTISAGAKEFKDDSKVKYDEAVAVISEIGVVDGYTDGNFNPQNVLTRGAAAKIICNMVLGPTTASALKADAAPFKDVPANHEFAGYIAYCAQQGIINGYSDGTFRPAGTLNGYAFMKMLLGALGYDGKIENFTGPNWTINVAKLAKGADLDKGNSDFVGSADVTREEAALYAFNTLKADMVEYDSKTTVNVGGAEVVISGSKAQVQAQGVYKDTMKEDGLQFAERYFEKLTKTNNDTDSFGRPAAEWKYKSNVIGTYADSSDLQATYTAKAKKGDLYSLIGSSIIDDLGTKKNGYNFTVYVDGEQVKNPSTADYFEKNSTKAAGVSGNGVLTEVYMNDDNDVTIVMINTYLVQATADYNKTKEEVNVNFVDNGSTNPGLDTSISQDDFDVSGVKEDDYLLVTWSKADKEFETVIPATVKSGKVTQYTEKDNVVMDGTTYKYNKLVGEDEQNEQFTINTEATLILDQYGYIIYVDDANSTSSYVYIQKVAGATNLNKKAVASAYFTDGTDAEINIKKAYLYDSNGKLESTTSGSALTQLATGWYTYTKNDAGDYTLTAVSTDASAKRYTETVSTFSQKQIIFNDKVKFMGSGIKGNDDTIFLTLDKDDEVDVYTGVANVPDVTLSSTNADAKVSYVADDKGYAKYVFIDVSKDEKADIDDAASVADYMLLLKNNGKKTYVDGDSYYQYDVILDGEVTTKYVAESLNGVDLTTSTKGAGNLYYSIKTNSKGYITDSTKLFTDGAKKEYEVLNLTDATIKQSKNSIVFTNGDKSATETSYIVSGADIYLAVGKNCALLKDDGADYETYVKTSAGTIAGLCTNATVDATVYAVMDDDVGKTDRVTYLYVYISSADVTETPVTPTSKDCTITVHSIVNLGNGITDTLDDVVLKVKTADLVDGKWTVNAPKQDGYTPVISSKNVTYVTGTSSYEVSFTYTKTATTGG